LIFHAMGKLAHEHFNAHLSAFAFRDILSDPDKMAVVTRHRRATIFKPYHPSVRARQSVFVFRLRRLALVHKMTPFYHFYAVLRMYHRNEAFDSRGLLLGINTHHTKEVVIPAELTAGSQFPRSKVCRLE